MVSSFPDEGLFVSVFIIVFFGMMNELNVITVRPWIGTDDGTPLSRCTCLHITSDWALRARKQGSDLFLPEAGNAAAYARHIEEQLRNS